jgi:Ca2+-binding EF-hand superfamily protein
VLAALDANQDLVISPWEIITAPAALRKLDTDHDGKLSPEECGFFLGANPQSALDPEFVKRARLEFMRVNPVLAALDADHDGEISETEIMNSAAALKTLDKNGDGSLTPDELIPDQPAIQAAMILSRLDTNGDGKISSAEWASDEAAPLRDLLKSADRNHNGFTTAEELKKELRLREEQKRQFDNASRAAGVTPSSR